jgi:hypothetical protein
LLPLLPGTVIKVRLNPALVLLMLLKLLTPELLLV